MKSVKRFLNFDRVYISLWILIWVFYLGRGLVRAEWAMYEKLLQKPAQHRMAILMSNPHFYYFIEHCRKNIPAEATYQLDTPFEPEHIDSTA